MTDKELSAFGERLYEAILMTPLPAGMVFAIATAIRQGVSWAKLAPPLKLAIFKIASNCAPVDAPGADATGTVGDGRETSGAAPASGGSSSGEPAGALPGTELLDEGPSETVAIPVGERPAAEVEAPHEGEREKG